MVLDMDGVVVDSNPWHVRAWELYNRRQGIEIPDLPDRMFGRRNDEIVRDLFGAHLSPAEIAAHGAAKEALYREMLGSGLAEALVPGVREFLERHQGQLVGLATNAEPANVDFILDGAGLRPCFRVVMDGHQVAQPKPHPEIYLRIAQLLNVAPGNCIVFEDSYSGVAAARAAGTRIVGIRTTYRALPGADIEIDDFRAPALEGWLRAQEPVES